jgi:integrase
MACIRKRRGKWIVDYRDGADVRHWKTCDTKREAEDFLDAERPKTRQWRQPAVDANITIGQYAVRWLDLIKPTIKPRTYRRYEELWRVHLKPSFEDVKVREVHRGRIKSFLTAKLIELKPPRAKKHGKVVGLAARQTFSRNTVRNIHATLRAMLNAALDDGVVLANPAEQLGRQLRLVTPKAIRQEEIKAMTRGQRRLFLEVAARHEPRYYPLFFTLAGTGMRLGEAIGLQWPGVDVLSREIRISQTRSAGADDTPKSGHGRTVDLSTALAEMLARFEIARKAETLHKGWGDVPRWVFCTEVGSAMDESKVRKVMRRVLNKAALPSHFTPHCLRHTYASLMLQGQARHLYATPARPCEHSADRGHTASGCRWATRRRSIGSMIVRVVAKR